MRESLQTALFGQIESVLAPHQLLVEEVGQVLDLSKDSAYRRIGGKTALSLDEAMALCQHFGVSLDALGGPRNGVVPFFVAAQQGQGNAALQGFGQLFNTLDNLDRAMQAEILYFCMEIPVFHFIQVPEILAFKWYYWQEFGQEGQRGQDLFALDVNPLTGHEDLINYVINRYIRIPSTEIIFRHALSASLMQILFFLESGKFANPKDALLLFDKIMALIEHLKLQAHLGRKFRFGGKPVQEGPPDHYRLFYNEMIPSQNVAHIQADEVASVYLEYNVVNFMHTRDVAYCRDTHQTLQKVLSKSTLISTVSEKERNKFFKLLEQEVLHARNKAEGIILHGG